MERIHNLFSSVDIFFREFSGLQFLLKNALKKVVRERKNVLQSNLAYRKLYYYY